MVWKKWQTPPNQLLNQEEENNLNYDFIFNIFMGNYNGASNNCFFIVCKFCVRFN